MRTKIWGQRQAFGSAHQYLAEGAGSDCRGYERSVKARDRAPTLVLGAVGPRARGQRWPLVAGSAVLAWVLVAPRQLVAEPCVFPPFTEVSAGAEHTCGLRADGRIECWGANDYGQSFAPLGVFRAVSAGGEHTCGLLENGRVECWGRNNYGQSSPPSGVFRGVSAGSFHTCALREDGRVECWGRGHQGRVVPPPGGFRSVSAGGGHTCGLREDGTVECWGRNDYGQSSPPSGVFRAVSAGGIHTCGLREDGRVKCWGSNDYGQSSPPSGVFWAVSAGWAHTCGLREDGGVRCWGRNQFRQSSAPLGMFRVVSSGGYHTCGLRDDGTVECWGGNHLGQSPPFGPQVLCYTVSSLADRSNDVDPGDGVCEDVAGECTLRAALGEVSASSSKIGLVSFSVSGEVQLRRPISVSGRAILDASRRVVVTGDGTFPLIRVEGGLLELKGFELRQGSSAVEGGNVLVIDSIVTAHTGVGIAASRSQILRTRISGNGGHGIGADGRVVASVISDNRGDGVAGSAVLEDSTISGNGGHGVGGDGQVVRSVIFGNGGHGVAGSGVVRGSTISSNAGDGLAGPGAVEDSTISGNGGHGLGAGGTLLRSVISDNGGDGVRGGTVEATRCRISSNAGVGVRTTGGRLRAVEVSQNRQGGVVVEEGEVAIEGSTVWGNQSPGDGGGIRNRGVIRLLNTTVSSNLSGGRGGGLFNGVGGTATVVHSTLAFNESYAEGGAVFNELLSESEFGMVRFKNSLVVGNQGSDGSCSGPLTTPRGVNFATDESCRDFTEATLEALALEPLGDYGGYTSVHSLGPASVAIDAASDCTDFGGGEVTEDQRGVLRPYGSACDVGAVEVRPESRAPIFPRSGCIGDCNGDGSVTIEEIISMVNVALGSTNVSVCLAGDANGDGAITVEEVVAAVNQAVNGC